MRRGVGVYWYPPCPPGYMYLKAFPSSSAWIFPAGVSSPPHFKINTKDGSRGLSAKYGGAYVQRSSQSKLLGFIFTTQFAKTVETLCRDLGQKNI